MIGSDVKDLIRERKKKSHGGLKIATGARNNFFVLRRTRPAFVRSSMAAHADLKIDMAWFWQVS